MANVSRGTIYNKIEDGELSRTADGIDTNELIRVFGDISLSGDGRKNRQNRTSSGVTDDVASTNDEIAQALLARLDKADDEKRWLREMYEAKNAELKKRDEQLQALLPAPGEMTSAEKLSRDLGERDGELKQLKEQLEAYKNASLWNRVFRSV